MVHTNVVSDSRADLMGLNEFNCLRLVWHEMCSFRQRNVQFSVCEYRLFCRIGNRKGRGVSGGPHHHQLEQSRAVAPGFFRHF